jgi:hypothetical protein
MPVLMIFFSEFMLAYDSKDYENLEEITETSTTTQLDPFEAEFEKLYDDFKKMGKEEFQK